MIDPVLLCAASGAEVGIGHLVRTRAVALELEAMGEAYRFLVDDDASIAWLQARGIRAERAGDSLPPARSAWLDGFRPWHAELEQLQAANIPAYLVENRIADRDRAAAVLYPALHYVPDAWDEAHPGRALGGAQWIPLGSTVREQARGPADFELVVSFGGSDPGRLTERCMASLQRMDFTGRTLVVVGPRMSDRRAAIEGLAGESIEVLSGQAGIGSFLARSQRVLTALGTTLYELAWLGVPGLVLANYEHDGAALEWYGEHGPHLPLGVAAELQDTQLDERLALALAATAGDRPLPRLELAGGAERIANLLVGAPLRAKTHA